MINENAKRNQYIKIALISIAIVALGLLVWKLDWAILEFFYNYVRNDILDPIVVFYTNLGDGGIIWIVVGIVVLIFATVLCMKYKDRIIIFNKRKKGGKIIKIEKV